MKRRLSASESASSTPAPGDALVHHPGVPAAGSGLAWGVASSAPESRRDSPDTAAPGGLAGLAALAGDGLAGDDSRAPSASATPAPGAAHEDSFVAKPGQIVPGSGDGTAYGAECFLWTDLPMNKTGFRYAPCAPSPTVSPAPHFPFYRTIPGAPPAPPVAISWFDRSAFLRMSPDALTVTTDRGFRSGRATVAVREGTWYYEAIVERGDAAVGGGRGTGGDGGNPHVRIGWGRREAGLDAPVGADAYGYGIRDVGGEKVHISRPRPYAGQSFGTGDVVGCLIHLPPRPPTTNEEDAAYVRRWRVPLRYKGQRYFEMDEYPVAKEMEALVNREGRPPPATPAEDETKIKVKKSGSGPATATATSVADPTRPAARRPLATLDGSYIAFFLNGRPLGKSFTDVYDFLPLPPLLGQKKKFTHAYEREREAYQYHDDGTLGYFPMVSCFGRGKVRVNFGPDWVRPPPAVPDDGDVSEGLPAGTRPLIERWDEFRAEEVVYDTRDETMLGERLVKEMAAAAEARAREPKPAPKRSKDKRRKKDTPAVGDEGRDGTPATGTPAPEGTATPRDGDGASTPGVFDRHTPGPGWSSPVRAPSTPAPDTAASTPAPGAASALWEPLLPHGTPMDVDGDGEDAEGEDANEGVPW